MIKTVVIGSGAMGRRHVQAVQRAEGFEFQGIADLREDALCKAREEGVPADRCFSDTGKMLRTVCPDCAIIATTAPSHAALAEQAVLAGVRMLLVEKPLSISLKELYHLRALCEARGIQLAVNHSVRFCTNYMKIKELASAPELGSLTSLTLSMGNIGLAMGASHQFELFHFLTGNAHDTVWAWFQENPWPNPRGAQFKDAAGQIRLENRFGQRHYLEIGPDQGHGMQMILGFPQGQIHVDLLACEAVVNIRKPEYREQPPTRYGMPAEIQRYSLPAFDVIDAAARMLEALRDGKNYPELDAAERITRTLVAAYVSAENEHRPIDIHGSLPEDREFPWA